MLHSCRLVTFGYWGEPFPPALSWNLEAAPTLINARRAFAQVVGTAYETYNPVRGVAILDPNFEKSWTGKRTDEGDNLPGLILDWRSLYPSSFNTTLPTSTDANAIKFLEKLSNPFGGRVPGLAYTRNTTEDFTFLSGDYGVLPSDCGWSRKVFLHQPPGEQKAPTWLTVWGNVAAGTGWALRVVKGRASVARLSTRWSQALELQLWAALEVEEDDDAPAGSRDAAREQRRQIEDTINVYEKSLELDGELHGRPFEVAVVPEGAGLSVFLNGARTAIKISEMERLPKSTVEVATLPTLWGAGEILTGSSQAYFWQNGYPEFQASGEVRLGSLLGTYETSEDLPVDQIAPRLNAYVPDGTAINIAKRYAKDKAGNDTKRVEIVAELTGDRRRSPILYRVNLVLKGGPRNGSLEMSFDTQLQALRDAITDPILDVVPQFEGESRRRQYQVFIRMKTGAQATLDHNIFPGLNAGNTHYKVLEDRTCTLYLDGQPVITNGLVKDATLVDPNSMAAIGGSAAITEVIMRGETVLSLTICDGWALCEEKNTRDEVADGYFKGEYLRLALGNVGFRVADLAGIDPQAGGRVKPIMPGEAWKVRPRRGQNYADWLRAFVKQYCPGWVLHHDKNGVWQFHQRNRAIVATFSSRYDTNKHASYPGRWTVLSKLELMRDTSDFYNVRSLYGAQGPNGEPLSLVWRIEESIRHRGGHRTGQKPYWSRKRSASHRGRCHLNSRLAIRYE